MTKREYKSSVPFFFLPIFPHFLYLSTNYDMSHVLFFSILKFSYFIWNVKKNTWWELVFDQEETKVNKGEYVVMHTKNMHVSTNETKVTHLHCSLNLIKPPKRKILLHLHQSLHIDYLKLQPKSIQNMNIRKNLIIFTITKIPPSNLPNKSKKE